MTNVGTIKIQCPCCKKRIMINIFKERTSEPRYELWGEASPLQKNLLGKEDTVGDLGKGKGKTTGAAEKPAAKKKPLKKKSAKKKPTKKK